GRPYLYGVSMAESFGAGLATAAFLSFLMRISDKRQAATQYALLTALYALPRSVLAPIGGKVADLWGYPTFFFLTFLLAIPSYFLLPWVYRWIGSNEQRPEGAGAETAEDASTGSSPDPHAPGQRTASATVR